MTIQLLSFGTGGKTQCLAGFLNCRFSSALNFLLSRWGFAPRNGASFVSPIFASYFDQTIPETVLWKSRSHLWDPKRGTVCPTLGHTDIRNHERIILGVNFTSSQPLKFVMVWFHEAFLHDLSPYSADTVLQWPVSIPQKTLKSVSRMIVRWYLPHNQISRFSDVLIFFRGCYTHLLSM